MRVAVIIPTLNARNTFDGLLSAISQQTLEISNKLVIDSGSDDSTVSLALHHGFKVHQISRAEFNHGATRQLGITLLPPGIDVAMFLTQDVILEDVKAMEALVEVFSDDQVGAAYGRQLPHRSSGLIGAHARIFNYPAVSQIKTVADAPVFGIKTAFMSNSFAAYRIPALEAVRGFPDQVILGEDSYVAAKMLLDGWKIAYCANAQVYHSHDYNIVEEFKRYFDIGVFHSQESWILQQFGKAQGEGFRYILSEIKYLWKKDRFQVPNALLRTALKFAGYRLGLMNKLLSKQIKMRLSMHRRYWSH